MKKIIFIIALLFSVGDGVWAQDTIWQRPAPLKTYFSNSWIDTSSVYGAAFNMTVSHAEICAQQFITDDTLQIYGIAAMMVDNLFPHSMLLAPIPGDTHTYTLQDYLNSMYPEDPTFNNLDEWLLLFQYHGPDSTATMNQLGDSLPVSYLQTPTYYMLSYRQPLGCYTDTVPKPVYERYFTEPQTVHDTFFAGFTQNYWRYNKLGYWYEYRPPFTPVVFCDHPANSHFLYEQAFLIRDTSYSSTDWEFDRLHHFSAYFLFPILTPDSNSSGGDTTNVNPNDTTIVNPGDTIVNPGDTIINPGDTIINPGDTIVVGNDTIAIGDTLIVCDTTIIGGDTIVTYDTILSIGQSDMLQRFTGVMPNPAVGVAKVVSSFGMQRVEVYNRAGVKVYDSRAAGLAHTLDVGRWPAGTYLVRIHTPQGVAVKKLVVR